MQLYAGTTMILGIDQSYTKLGYVVINNDSEVISHGTFATDKTKDIYDRAIEATKFVIQQIETHKITRLHIEGLAFGMTGNATRDLAGLLFTIITHIRQVCPKVTIHIYAPTAVKKTATGSGKAGKADMISHLPEDVRTRFSKTHKKTTGLQDIADAYWIARTTGET